MKKLLIAILFINMAQAQTFSVSNTLSQLDNYELLGDDLATDVIGLRNGNFSWSWAQNPTDQINWTPLSTTLNHDEDFVVNVERAGQSGNVTVTVTSEVENRGFYIGGTTAPDFNTTTRHGTEILARNAASAGDYIWHATRTTFEGRIGETVIRSSGNGGGVVLDETTRLDIVAAADDRDVLGPWSYSHDVARDPATNDWIAPANAILSFGSEETAFVRVTRTRTVIVNGDPDTTPVDGARSGLRRFRNMDYISPEGCTATNSIGVDGFDAYFIGRESTDGAAYDSSRTRVDRGTTLYAFVGSEIFISNIGVFFAIQGVASDGTDVSEFRECAEQAYQIVLDNL